MDFSFKNVTSTFAISQFITLSTLKLHIIFCPVFVSVIEQKMTL